MNICSEIGPTNFIDKEGLVRIIHEVLTVERGILGEQEIFFSKDY